MISIPNTWISVTDKRVLDLRDKIIKIIIDNKLTSANLKCYGIYTSKKPSMKALGRCKWLADEEVYAIWLSPLIINGPQKELENTLIHEIAHGYTPYAHHGNCWYYLANNIASHFNCGTINRFAATTSEAVSQLREIRKQTLNTYFIKCPKCNTYWIFHRKCDRVKYPFLYLHKKCGSYLVRDESKDIINH